MNLITTYYKTLNQLRNDEIDSCLNINCQNNNIDEIYLLNNILYDLSFINDPLKKITQYIISNEEDYKLKYSDAIKFINEKMKGKICILSNSDIYFDDTLSKINNTIIKNNFFALLRYDEDLEKNKNIFKRFDVPRDDSQDCWIFLAPLNISLNKINFSLGTLGCDSIFAYYIYETGINLSNPSLDIVATHRHITNFRTYTSDDIIHGKYCLIKPCHIGEKSEIKFLNY